MSSNPGFATFELTKHEKITQLILSGLHKMHDHYLVDSCDYYVMMWIDSLVNAWHVEIGQ